jgi:Fic family protein
MVKRLDELASLRNGAVLFDPAYRMATTVKFACQVFVAILTIHPFANGNGHIARSLLWAILIHFGYAVPAWTIDPRPPFSEYASMIEAHRRGNVDLRGGLSTNLIAERQVNLQTTISIYRTHVWPP